jgi:hypothetical protein
MSSPADPPQALELIREARDTATLDPASGMLRVSGLATPIASGLQADTLLLDLSLSPIVEWATVSVPVEQTKFGMSYRTEHTPAPRPGDNVTTMRVADQVVGGARCALLLAWPLDPGQPIADVHLEPLDTSGVAPFHDPAGAPLPELTAGQLRSRYGHLVEWAGQFGAGSEHQRGATVVHTVPMRSSRLEISLLEQDLGWEPPGVMCLLRLSA